MKPFTFRKRTRVFGKVKSLLFTVLGIYNFAWPSVEYRFSSTEDLACLRSPSKVSTFISESVPFIPTQTHSTVESRFKKDFGSDQNLS